MLTLILIIHVIVCFMIIFLVLLQAGKAIDMSSLIDNSKHSYIDSTGVNSFMNKATKIVAIFFVFTSLTIGYMNNIKENQIIVIDNPNENVIYVDNKKFLYKRKNFIL